VSYFSDSSASNIIMASIVLPALLGMAYMNTIVAANMAPGRTSPYVKMTRGPGVANPACSGTPDGNPAYIVEVQDSQAKPGKCVAGGGAGAGDESFTIQYAGASEKTPQPLMSPAECKRQLLEVEDNAIHGADFKRTWDVDQSWTRNPNGTCALLSGHDVASAMAVVDKNGACACYQKVFCSHSNTPTVDDDSGKLIEAPVGPHNIILQPQHQLIRKEAATHARSAKSSDEGRR